MWNKNIETFIGLDASFDDLDEHAASKATEAMATPVIPRIFLSFITNSL